MKQHHISDVFALQGSIALLTAIVFCMVNLFSPAFCADLLRTLSAFSDSVSIETLWQELTAWYAL